MPEAEEVDIDIDTKDLRIDTYRAQGAGGQHVNKTDSAVRITHLPSNIVVQCQDEKSQHKNRAKALKLLRAKLYDEERLQREQERAADRKNQVGSGDRSERIRTYNFRGRVTDHRINLTLYKLDRIMEGELDEVIDAWSRTNRPLLAEIAIAADNIGDTVRSIGRYLEQAGIDEAVNDRLIIGHALGLTRSEVIGHKDKKLSETQLNCCRSFAKRRSNHEPMAYLTGEKNSWSSV